MKNYTNPTIEVLNFNTLDIITVSTPLSKLDPIAPSQGGNDPSMEDGIVD